MNGGDSPYPQGLGAVPFLFLLACCALLLCASCQAPRGAGLSPDEQGPVFSAVEKTFVLMGERKSRELWESISRKSRDGIVNDILRSCEARKISCDGEGLRADFARGGPAATIYWANYLGTFDPNSILKDSTWRLGAVTSREADVVIRHKDAERDAIIKVVKEDGAWKMGLEESFGVRKWMMR